MKESRVNGDDHAIFQAIKNWLLEPRHEFPVGALHMGLVAKEVAKRRGFLRALRFSLSISKPVLYIFFYQICKGWTIGSRP